MVVAIGRWRRVEGKQGEELCNYDSSALMFGHVLVMEDLDFGYAKEDKIYYTLTLLKEVIIIVIIIGYRVMCQHSVLINI